MRQIAYPAEAGEFLSRNWRNTVASLPSVFTLWLARRRERQVLSTLSDRQLRDIGVSRAMADREASLPFWRDRS